MHPDRPSPYPPATAVAGDPIADAALNDALEDALEQGDLINTSRLAFELSVRFHRIECYSVAISYSDLALEAWREFFDTRPIGDLAPVRFTELRMLNASATQLLNRGQFDAAAERIQEARRLATFLPGVSLIASTEWNAALMERWRRDFPKALEHALRAWSVYRRHSDPMSVARLSQFVVEVALDCVSLFAARGAEQQAAVYLRLAHAYLEYGRPPLNERNAEIVDGKFRMVYSIYSRLMGKNEDRVRLLESVAQFARSLDDSILEGQVYNTLGDEFSSQHRIEEALTCYRRAFHLLLSSHAPSLAVWPLRALKHDWEYNLDLVAHSLH
jgi:tetratricopeptide (TPR) repeat protein